MRQQNGRIHSMNLHIWCTDTITKITPAIYIEYYTPCLGDFRRRSFTASSLFFSVAAMPSCAINSTVFCSTWLALLFFDCLFDRNLFTFRFHSNFFSRLSLSLSTSLRFFLRLLQFFGQSSTMITNFVFFFVFVSFCYFYLPHIILCLYFALRVVLVIVVTPVPPVRMCIEESASQDQVYWNRKLEVTTLTQIFESQMLSCWYLMV